MQRIMLKSKIHLATVTGKRTDYEGSLTLDPEMMEMADILEHEKVYVANAANGARFETYAISGQSGDCKVILNGAAARLGETGDKIIIMAFAVMDTLEARDCKPRLVFVDETNRIVEKTVRRES